MMKAGSYSTHKNLKDPFVSIENAQSRTDMSGFYSLKLIDIIRFSLKQSVSFYLVLTYMVFEYMRPQAMYPVLDFIPWGQTVLLLSLAAVMIEGKLFKAKHLINILIVLFFFIILISSVFAISFEDSWNNHRIIIVLLLGYFIIINAVDNIKKFYIFTGLFILLSFKLAQFNFRHWVMRGFEYDGYAAAAGIAWLGNPGELAIQMCILFVISFYFSISVWRHVESKIKRVILLFIPVVAVGAVISCGSRGSFLALAVVMFLMFMFSKRKMVGLLLLLVFAISVPYILSERDKVRLYSMTNPQRDGTSVSRLERWDKGIYIALKNPVLGVGYNNWAAADKLYFNGDGDLSHNIFIEAVSELGFTGLFVFIALIVATIKTNNETIRLSSASNFSFNANIAKGLNLSLAAYIVAGFFVTVLYYPYFWINLAMTVSLNNVTKKSLVNEKA